MYDIGRRQFNTLLGGAAATESRQPAVLCGFHNDLRADLSRSAGGSGVRGAGGSGKAVLCHHPRRIRPCAQSDGDAVQHDLGGATVKREATKPHVVSAAYRIWVCV